MPAAKDKDLSQIRYSCSAQKSREITSFVQEHALIRILAGHMLVHTTANSYNFATGDTVLIKRSQLAKVNKLPPVNGEFKRDFAKIFHTPPNKWLQQRRLKEAHYLIKEKRMKVSDVYLEVGFEDLSHFSFAFKNTFGKSPSLI